MASAQQQKCAGKLYFSSVQMVAYSFHSIMAASKEHELKILKLNVKIYTYLPLQFQQFQIHRYSQA